MDNVVNIFEKKKEPKEKEESIEEKTEFTFEEIIQQNKANQERVARERAKSNKGVTRSYRLKT